MPDLASLLHPAVGIYIVAVVLIQIGLVRFRTMRSKHRAQVRQEAGLDDTVLADHAVTLGTLRSQALVDALVLVFSIVGLPFLMIAFFTEDTGVASTATAADDMPSAQQGLALAFLTLIVWVLVSSTDVARSFLGGIAFRAFVAFRKPFQVGDRVTLLGYSGKVAEIGPFHVRLQTLDDDLVSIPSIKLWSEPLISANAGDRASLCVMTFHLAPFVTAKQRQQAEQAIWDAIQCSVYWDFDKPAQIYVEQRQNEILFTAKAYSASTYNEPDFKSEITQAFLDAADDHGIPLASTRWRSPVPSTPSAGE